MKKIRLTNVEGRMFATHAGITELRSWLAGSEPRRFIGLDGTRKMVDPARVVRAEWFAIRVGSMRWEQFWSR